MIVAAWHVFGGSGWFWHPLSTGSGSTCSATSHTGCGYSFWSGFVGDIGLITIAVGGATFFWSWYRKHNCHVHRCWRLSWREHPEHGHPVCAVHHPDGHHGFWWRLTHWKPHDDAHFLAAKNHGYNHHVNDPTKAAKARRP